MASQTLKETTSLQMHIDPELYSKSNNITRAAATECLEEYASKLKWKSAGERIYDIGCGDGSVTNILIKYVPKDYEKLIGYDISEKMVEFANAHYGDERTKFMTLDIVGDLPKELKESFDHGFSFCTFHWIRNQEKGFTNIFNMLTQGGECLVTFFGKNPMHNMFSALSGTKKWSAMLTGSESFQPPYRHIKEPAPFIVEMFKKIGFQYVDVQCKQRVFVFESTDALKSILKAINPFRIPKNLNEDFLDDLIEAARDMGMVDKVNNTATFNYELFVVHCRK